MTALSLNSLHQHKKQRSRAPLTSPVLARGNAPASCGDSRRGGYGHALLDLQLGLEQGLKVLLWRRMRGRKEESGEM